MIRRNRESCAVERSTVILFQIYDGESTALYIRTQIGDEAELLRAYTVRQLIEECALISSFELLYCVVVLEQAHGRDRMRRDPKHNERCRSLLQDLSQHGLWPARDRRLTADP